jgi:hypothetical protein
VIKNGGAISINEQKTADSYLEMSKKKPLNKLFDFPICHEVMNTQTCQ